MGLDPELLELFELLYTEWLEDYMATNGVGYEDARKAFSEGLNW